MKLFTSIVSLFIIGAAAAQNPTILQGSYVSNVFGQSNFVKNPNAQTNTANVTLTTATATRSTTTPLVATTEWNVTITSANGTAAWATRTFDAGMKNQNCEARFTYRGFQATSKAQIKQGANVVAELALTPATDPRIASINFPCGDLSSATTFVITDTATLAGTNEIGGIYVGLATNQANVAQAEYVVGAYTNAALSIPNSADTTVVYQNGFFNKYGEYNESTGTFTASRAGDYLIEASTLTQSYNWTSGELHGLTVYSPSKGIAFGRDRRVVDAALTKNAENRVVATASLNAGDTIQILLFQNQGATVNLINDSVYNRLNIYRFPSSSELVVTPETQNVWGAVEWSNNWGSASAGYNSTAPTAFSTFSATNIGSTTYRTLKGKCAAPTTANTHIGCSIENMPVGNYKITLDAIAFAIPSNNSSTTCVVQLEESTTSTVLGNRSFVTYADSSGNRDWSSSSITGIFQNQSVGTRNFVLTGSKRLGALLSACYIDSSTVNQKKMIFTIEPLDNNANSALYVQGPVKASGTGTTIPSGYVNNLVYENFVTAAAASTGFENFGNVNLSSPGIYQIKFHQFVDDRIVSSTIADRRICIGNTSSSCIANTIGKTQFDDTLVLSSTNIAQSRGKLFVDFIVRSDGTTLTAFGGTYGIGTLLYFNGQIDQTASNLRYAYVTVIRLN